MTNPQADPSMEDILASIRRIISEDEEDLSSDDQAKNQAAQSPNQPEAQVETQNDPDIQQTTAQQDLENDPSQEADEDEEASQEDAELLTKLEALTRDDFAHPKSQTGDSDDYEMSKQSDHTAPEETQDDLHAQDNVVSIQDDQVQAEEEELTMVGESSAAAASKAFENLSESLRIANKEGGTTLEDIVTEMVHPMIKEWLDANLPAIVEQAVEDEVQRLARRRR